MAIKLHTCGMPWLGGPHPCHRVKSALEEQGIELQLVKHPSLGRGRRKELKALTGQDRLPVIEFEDGSILREESAEMAARVRAGRLRGERAAQS